MRRNHAIGLNGAASSRPVVGCLNFAGVPSNVNHGKFWTLGNTYGDGYWSAWVKPTVPNITGYYISDGSGGQHNVLNGVSTGASTFTFTGNIFDGVNNAMWTMGTVDTIPLNEWVHYEFVHDNPNNLYVLINGICTFYGKMTSGGAWTSSFIGTRSYLEGGSDGNLYIGGSFHNNFPGYIARVRGIEGSTGGIATENRFIPRDYDGYVLDAIGSTRTRASFTTDYSVSGTRSFIDIGEGMTAIGSPLTQAAATVTQITSSSTGVTVNALTGAITTVALTTGVGAEERFTVTNNQVAAGDVPVLSTTYNGAGTVGLSVQKVATGVFDVVITNLHAANAFNAAMVINFSINRADPNPRIHHGAFSRYNSATAYPQWVANEPSPSTYVPTAPATPNGALVFDSFSRANNLALFDNQETLGSTEAGSLGVKVWNTPYYDNSNRGVGILYGRAIIYPSQVTTGAWVSTDRTNVDIRVTRPTNPWASTGILARYKDGNNYYIVRGYDTLVDFTFLEGGSTTYPTGFAVAGGWSELKVVMNGTTMSVYTDGVLAGTKTVLNDAGATKHGIATSGTVARYDNFTILAVS